MSKKEIDILNLFPNSNTGLTNKEIGAQIDTDDPSQYTKTLYYFGYLEKRNGKFYRSSRQYDEQVRASEETSIIKDYTIVLNKIFAGAFLTNNLGHELINFIKDECGQRYVYLNPWGERGEEASGQTKYAFHIIESSIKKENGVYELAAVSVIDTASPTIYNSDKQKEIDNSPSFNGKTFYKIFQCGDDSDKAHIYTYKASQLLIPANNIRIIIKVKQDEATFVYNQQDNTITITLICNPQHSIAYADVNKRTRYILPQNQLSDVDVLKMLVNNGYLVPSNADISLDDLDDEQCLSVICDRTNLEDSTSNQIAYFLRRDKHLAYLFLHDFLGITTVTEQEKFEIIREKEHIDLLFVSKNHVVVVENKIDAEITNKSKTPNANGKHTSQLSNYYTYITTKEYSCVPNKHFFVLAPEYNPLTQNELNNVYESGNYYTLKSYRDLYNSILAHAHYQPLGRVVGQNTLGYFLFREFVRGIQYISWSKAKQRETTAYIRLKQRMQELETEDQQDNE